MTNQTTASVLFQTAYESRYTWDENFPGYSADVQLVQGDNAYRGKIRINRDFSIEVTDIADAEVKEGISIQLREIVTHRQRTNFQESHGKFEFTMGDTDETGVVEILVKADSIDSRYKIRGQEICQETRVMGRMAVVINTLETWDVDVGYIANRYDVVFRNSKTNEVSSVLKFSDTYEKVGDYYILTKQVVQDYQQGIDEPQSVTEFSYFNIKLLEPAMV